MGLAGVRDRDNMQFFDSKKPLVVVYYDVDYERNPKGKWELLMVITDWSVNCLSVRFQLLEEQVWLSKQLELILILFLCVTQGD